MRSSISLQQRNEIVQFQPPRLWRLAQVQSSVFNELYLGGGSPSVFSKEQIVNLLRYCKETFQLKLQLDMQNGMLIYIYKGV